MFMSPMERVKQLVEEKKKIEAVLDSNKPISLKELAAVQEKLRVIEEEIKKLEQRTKR